MIMFVRWLAALLFICSVCEGKQASECSHDEFPCNDGTCVHKSKWCDSSTDCDDDTDELYCFTKSGLVKNPNRCNQTTFFLCRDGRCIPMIGRCDGYRSCFDNSDEEECGIETEGKELYSPTKRTSMKTTRLPRTISDINHATEIQNTHVDLQPADSPFFPTAKASSVENTKQPENVTVHVLKPLNELNAAFLNNTGSDDLLRKSNIPVIGHEISPNLVELHDDIMVDKTDLNTEPSNITLQDIKVRHGVLPINSISAYHDVVIEHMDILVNSSVTKSTTSSENEVHNGLAFKETEIPANGSQADSASSKKTKVEDLEHGFVEINPRDFRRERDNAKQWLLKSRDGDYGWGDETARAIIALYMSEDDFMKKQLDEKMLMSKQLNLKLFTALVRNETKRISLGELSLYINALSASCEDPRNFYGQDLVNILRHRTNAAEKSSEVVPPLVYLTLCLNNVTTNDDLRKIVHGTKRNKIGVEALVSLAATCISRKLNSASYGRYLAKNLQHKIATEGLPENVYELALLSQALNEARINQDTWKRGKALNLLVNFQQSDGSFGDILSTYYAIPVLSGKSLLSLAQHCHQTKDKGLIPIAVLKNGKDEKMFVRFSLYFGNPVEVSQSLVIKVQKSSNFLDIMRIAKSINPLYRFRYDMSKGKPTVYSIGEVVNDAEQGLYWTLHVSSNNSSEKFVPYEGDIRTFVPSPEEQIVFWMKSIF